MIAPAFAPVADVVAGLGEGPVWEPERGTVLWVDIPGGVLHRTDPVTGVTTSRELGAPLARALPLPDGSTLLARGDDLLVLPAGGGDPVPWVSFPHRPNMRLNDGIWDRAGRLLIGTMVLPQQEGGPAALWRVDGDGSRHELVDGLRLSNGLAWSPDGRLFHVDTAARRIWAHHLDDPGVTSGVFADVERGAGNPDGLTVDAEGHVWVCLFGAGTLRRYTPDGRVAADLPLPVRHATSCVFAGTTLFVTTASNRLDDAGRRAQPWAGRLLAASLPVAGFAGALGTPPPTLQGATR